MKRLLSLFLGVLFFLTACAPSDAPLSSVGPTATVEGTTAPTATGHEPEPTLSETETAEAEPFVILHPTAWPDYTFDHTPTTEELRATAVAAQHDEIYVRWTPAIDFEFAKSYSSSGTIDYFRKGMAYIGLPYTAGKSGLIQFLTLLDPDTGILGGVNYYFLGTMIGNVCNQSVEWGWRAVCTRVECSNTYEMVYQNGFYPVGEYVYDLSIQKYYGENSTNQICKNNGREVMYSSYAAVLPADALVTNDGLGSESQSHHARMAIEAAHVEYLEDGSIDGAKSYLLMQHQTHTTQLSVTPLDGQAFLHRGAKQVKCSFQNLFDTGYLPVTAAEFIGQKAYEAPWVRLKNAAGTERYADLISGPGSVESNYVIASVILEVYDAAGEKVDRKNVLLNQKNIEDGTAYDYPLSALSKTLPGVAEGCRVTVTVATTTGQRVKVADCAW